jgi:S-methylmethionine-dependent homocysteine/selenocysteine methylase
MAEAVRDLPVQALLLNCSTPEAIGKALPLLAESGKEFGAYANGFETVEPLKPGGTVDALTARRDLDPEAYAETALAWHEMGATVLGGCCEVGPGHISRLHERLQERETAVIGLEESK